MSESSGPHGVRDGRSETVLVAAFAVIFCFGATGCAGIVEKPTRLTDAGDAFRAHSNPYRPEFLRFKSSTDLGYRALTVKDYDKAAWHLEFEIKNNPADPAPRLYLGQVYAETGRIAKAQALYQSAITLGPSATITRGITDFGRPVSEVAAERLAALDNPPEIENTAPTGLVEPAPAGDGELGPSAPSDVTVTRLVPRSPIPMTPEKVANSLGAAPDTTPETIIISSASGPRSPSPSVAEKPVLTMAVHLASYKHRENADAGWKILRRRYPELRNLEPAVVETDLGPVKGIYYRLVAGGLPSTADARDLCRALKSKGKKWCQIGTLAR